MDKTELNRISQLCAIAYLREDAALLEYGKLGFKPLALHESAGQLDEAFLLTKGKCAIVVIRGSDEPGDWICRNLLAFRPIFRSQLHPGFRRGAQAVYRRLRVTLYGVDHIEVVGHSKGGAIAAILGEMLQKHYQVKIRTLAAPLFCRADHAAKYTADLIHVIHPRDVVPRLPFRCFRYVECGQVRLWDGFEFDAMAIGEALQQYPTRSLLWGMLRGGVKWHFDYGEPLSRHYGD